MKIVIVDGYTDEPAGLGVPPYVDIYPRYIAGAVWCVDPSIPVHYLTIDQVRENRDTLAKLLDRETILIVIAGVVTPGKYLKYTPITREEIEYIANLASQCKLRILCGPVARFGFAEAGGDIAVEPSYFKKMYDLVVSGDPDLVVWNLVKEGFQESKVDVNDFHRDDRLLNMFAVKGSQIVMQHPCYGKNLIVEIETYRSCPRYVTGGCSFCTTVRRGPPLFRDLKAIVKEVEALYKCGVRHFRIGRQADILTYMAKDVGKIEFPKPRPEIIEKLFHGIRNAAPDLETLHIDNVNPGTVAHWPIESREALKIVMLYHTPGDVAAMGIETADPRVVKSNNLKVYPDEAYFAVKLVSELGRVRGWNGMPHLLPGINFVLGLPGETKETYVLNREFLEKLLSENILVRRVNIRLAMVFPGTPLWSLRHIVKSNIQRHRKYIESFRHWVRNVFDVENLRRILPSGTILYRLYTEMHDPKGGTYARQVGSYPLIVYIPEKLPLDTWINVVVVDHLPRSVIAIPYPLNVNTCSLTLLSKVPGIDRRKALEIVKRRPFRDLEEVRKIVGDSVKYLTVG